MTCINESFGSRSAIKGQGKGMRYNLYGIRVFVTIRLERFSL
jgi:hypothetical protein